ncbi:hypothetical protein KIN20_005588 [Parelaphostrongylus tenuis]|uniref:FERM domain-containing protein n=1 Tax=Parelaphostrongylus tenuis TaxID=148309 RepID=A0AAD5MIY5_PARTN|nr:hypothetical protein KIN20_005588 [Parelaphostrongylus tenuis]
MKRIAEQLLIVDYDRFLRMFGLFLARPRDHSNSGVNSQLSLLVVRLLRNFESPYATFQTVNRQSATEGVYYKLVIRKMIWDPRVEESLFDDPVFVDLLFRQAKSDLLNGFFSASSESIAESLYNLEAKKDKLQVGSVPTDLSSNS